jgi:hypothetical protein
MRITRSCVTFPAGLRVFSSAGNQNQKNLQICGENFIKEALPPSGYLKPSKNRAWVGFNETTDSFLGNYLTLKNNSDQIQEKVRGESFIFIDKSEK